MPSSGKAVVLLSGGVDSATSLALARDEGFEIFALTVDYGQRSRAEIEAARDIASSLGARVHLVLEVELGRIGASALMGDGEIPRAEATGEPDSGVPVTYVPARNTILLSLALAWAETIGATDIFIGANAVDYSGYPDCRPEYIDAFQRLADLATRCADEGRPIKVRAPLVDMAKSEILKLGHRLGVDYSLTSSCYDPDREGLACGVCESCVLRRKGFEKAGLEDPSAYRSMP